MLFRLFCCVATLLPVLLLADPLPQEFYLAQGQENVLIRGGEEAGRFGQAVFVRGDINGDGYMDMLVGAPQASGPAGVGVGKTYVFYGSTSFPDTIDLSVTSASVTISGMVASEWSGYSLASGDFNGDGFDDIAIGALYSQTALFYHGGRVYVLYGGPTLPSVIDLAVDSADVIISGNGYDVRLGASVAAGEINGDGRDDLLMAATYADMSGVSNGGAVFVLFGAQAWEPRIDLSHTPAGLSIWGGNSEDHLGTALAVGDVNADCYDDLLIGAPDADPQGRMSAGIAYVLFGASTLPNVIRFSETEADVTIFGASTGNRLGMTAAVGDFNWRSPADIVVGAPYANTAAGNSAGEVYIILGNHNLNSIYDLASAVPNVRIRGANALDNAGGALAMGDVNGDGYDDLLVGAYTADVGSESSAGICYLIYGRSVGNPLVLDLASGASNVTIYGNHGSDFAGRALGIMDINGDGFGDMEIGASGADPPGGVSAGETYVINGDGVNPNFGSYRSFPGGDQPRIRFLPQNAWVKFVNGTSGDVLVSKMPFQPPNTSDTAADVWWTIAPTSQNYSNVQVAFRYTEEQIAGLDESELTLWRRTQSVVPFVLVPGADVDTYTNRISATVNDLGQFAIGDEMHPLGVEEGTGIPAIIGSYRLYPAVPNPFNGSVTLTYDLPAKGNVQLVVYNVLGQEAARIVNGTQMPGRYRILWDPRQASSGIYFAVLSVNGFSGVLKLLLLR
jgi:hypothetical protein